MIIVENGKSHTKTVETELSRHSAYLSNGKMFWGCGKYNGWGVVAKGKLCSVALDTMELTIESTNGVSAISQSPDGNYLIYSDLSDLMTCNYKGNVLWSTNLAPEGASVMNIKTSMNTVAASISKTLSRELWLYDLKSGRKFDSISLEGPYTLNDQFYAMVVDTASDVAITSINRKGVRLHKTFKISEVVGEHWSKYSVDDIDVFEDFLLIKLRSTLIIVNINDFLLTPSPGL